MNSEPIDAAVAEGYVNEQGAITEEGLEAFALGQGPFAMKVVDRQTGEAYVIQTRCEACKGYFPSGELRMRVVGYARWVEMNEAVCVHCAGEETIADLARPVGR